MAMGSKWLVFMMVNDELNAVVNGEIQVFMVLVCFSGEELAAMI